MIEFFNIPPLSIAGITGYTYTFGGFLPPYTSEIFVPIDQIVYKRGWWYPEFGAIFFRLHWVYYRRNISNGGATV